MKMESLFRFRVLSGSIPDTEIRLYTFSAATSLISRWTTSVINLRQGFITLCEIPTLLLSAITRLIRKDHGAAALISKLWKPMLNGWWKSGPCTAVPRVTTFLTGRLGNSTRTVLSWRRSNAESGSGLPAEATRTARGPAVPARNPWLTGAA